MPDDFAGKTIVVTGASSGIGRAAAIMLGARGAHVLLAARDGPALEAVAGTIRAGGGRADVQITDVGKREDTEALFARADALWDGVVDGVFANAGASGVVAPLWEYPLDAFEDVLSVNLRSVFWAMRLVMPGMVARGRGAFVATASLAAERGLPDTVGYNVSKHGVMGLVRTAAIEAAPHGVRVNAVIPGLIETRMLNNLADLFSGGDVPAAMTMLGKMAPQGRVGTPEEAAAAAVFLLSDAATYINGQAVAVDGGILAGIGGRH